MSRLSSFKCRGVIVVVILLALAGSLPLCFIDRRQEPVYQGQRLSRLLDNYAFYWGTSERKSPDEIAANAALGFASTNAIPTLLHLIEAKDSKLKMKLVSAFRHQKLIAIHYVPAHMRNYAGAYGFKRLGALATTAISALNDIYKKDVSEDSKSAAAEAMAAIQNVGNDVSSDTIRGSSGK